MHCCASSAAKEEALIPWTRDPSGRLQSRKKSEFRRTTDLTSTVSARASKKQRHAAAADGRPGERDDFRRPAAALRRSIWSGGSPNRRRITTSELGELSLSRLPHREPYGSAILVAQMRQRASLSVNRLANSTLSLANNKTTLYSLYIRH